MFSILWTPGWWRDREMRHRRSMAYEFRPPHTLPYSGTFRDPNPPPAAPRCRGTVDHLERAERTVLLKPQYKRLNGRW